MTTPVSRRVRSLVKQFLLDHPQGGKLNGHVLAQQFNHTQDYVLYCLRETPHVCRHTIGDGWYLIHPDKECGINCNKFDQTTPRSKVNHITCSNCFMQRGDTIKECEHCS